MSVLVEVQTFLEALGTLGTIYRGHLPPEADVAGCVYQYGGLPAERRFGVSGVGYERPAIQVVFRGAPYDYDGPMAKAYIALNALAAVFPGTVGGVEYLEVNPVQAPFAIEAMDANNRHKIGFNVYIKKVPS